MRRQPDKSVAERLKSQLGSLNGHAPKAADPTPEPWAPPLPLSRQGDVPAFPAELLPPWLSQWVLAEAEATQTPADLAGNLVLAIAGAALARKVRVRVRPGWTEPANIFVEVSLPPGDRKSAVFAHATGPLLDHEAAERQRMESVIAELASEHRVMEARLKWLETKVAKADRAAEGEDAAEVAGLRHEAKELAKKLAKHVVPDPPKLFTDDVTPEKLGQLLARQGGRMLLASAEGTAFEIAKGRYSETANFDVFLKAHAGDPLRTDRMNRESEALDHPALSCALCVQPDVISGLSEQASMRGRGFLARWLYATPASKVGARKVAPTPVPQAVLRDYYAGMVRLWRAPGADDSGPGQEWPFAQGADEALREMERWLEPQLAEGEPLSHLAGWANKLSGAAARLSLILHMSATLGVERDWAGPISVASVKAAITLATDYYLPHARAAFGLMGTDERAKDAARAVAWLAAKCETVKECKGGAAVVSKRDIHAGVFGGSRTVEQVGRVCQLLTDHGYLRPLVTRRKDSHLFEVNPDTGDDAQNG
jgi:hypothetical protein